MLDVTNLNLSTVAESLLLLLLVGDAVRVGGGVLAVADEPHVVLVCVARPNGGVPERGALLPGETAQRRAQRAATRAAARDTAEAAVGQTVGRVHEDRKEHRRRH